MNGSLPRGAHIVVHEPDELIRQLVQLWLGDAGYVVSTGTQSESRPDLLILDAAHPGHVGSRLSALGFAPDTPVLVVSASFRRGLGASTNTARRFGARSILPKPCTQVELLAAVAAALDPNDK
jgi:DNA-binding response OmpR family regulator